MAPARGGIPWRDAAAAGFDPVTVAFEADDRATGRLLGGQLFGHKHAEVAKRTDIAATAIRHGMTVDERSRHDHRTCHDADGTEGATGRGP